MGLRTFDFANRLKALRQAAGLSPEDIAVRLGVNADDIAAWEKGECLPDLKTTYRLAGMLNVSMDDLLTALPAAFMSAVSMTYILMAKEGFGLSAKIAYPAGIVFAAALFFVYIYKVRKFISKGNPAVQ